jgi:sarcosine oxidase subunit alpha
MTQPFRTESGGRIDRDRPINFRFDGRRYQGFQGDSLASALLANDVSLIGRSFKYHRPRGILSAGSEEPNALVVVDRGAGRVTPNLRATQIELYDGLTARSQNRFPTLRFDLGAIAGLAAPLLPAGFPYKTFMGPAGFWKRLYEPAIRRAAGLGRAPRRADPDRYLHHYAHCDVLIIGGGPAGLAAALGASATGARVILCDEQAELGGSLLHQPNVTIDDWPAPDWAREAVDRLAGSVTLLSRTTAFGWYPGNMIGLLQRVTDHLADPPATLPRERLWQVRAGRIVLATGAIERPLLFPGNDRPGIMLAEAARTYLHRYGVKVGQRAVIATACDSAYRAAIDLHKAGVTVPGIVDQRPEPAGQIVDAARSLGIPVHSAMTIGSTEGRGRVHTAKLSNGVDIIPCDTILMSGGWTPSVHLFSQSRGKLLFDAATATYLPSEGAVGGCAGVFGLADCLRDGTVAGGSEPRSFSVTGFPAMAPAAPPAPPPRDRAVFVDFQNDVTTKDLGIATDEGFVSIEHVKRYTTAGMATDQGKTSGLNTMAAVAALTGQAMESVGQTTFRPPYTPVSFGALAGPYRAGLYAPVRLPPVATPNAVLEDAGTWKRARCFQQSNETIEAAVAREALAVRNEAGMLDASTLGKIEVAGPDAARFLSRIYTGDFTTLPPGRCRYAVLLGEDGFIRDDGIVARLPDDPLAGDHFHVTTTTSGAAFVLGHMEDYLQTEFTDMRVWLTSITEQWAVIALQGPRSAEALAPFVTGIDLAAMPHMSVRLGRIGDIPIRLFRVSFTGEAGFEINLPPNDAQRVWDSLRERGVTPYGTDAMHLLRAEKGHIIVGQDTDGTVTPHDAGLGWTIRGPDFVGKRSLALPDLARPDRKQLVGLLSADPTVLLQEGAAVTPSAPGDRPAPAVAIGHVTSSYRSPTLGRTIALALIAGGRSRIGESLLVAADRGPVAVTVTDPVFLDKPGERLRCGDFTQPPAQPLLPAVPESAFVARPCDAVRLSILAPTLRLSIRAGASAATAIGLALGVLLPTVPCRSVIGRTRAALWMGPDEWLIVAPETETDLAAKAVKAAFGGNAKGGNIQPGNTQGTKSGALHAASVVDVSHRSRTLEITGPQAAWCLNGFCALDVDLSAFPVGMCTRTRLGAAEVLLWRIAPEVFHVDVARSFVPYVWACLEEVRLEFTYSGTPSDRPAGAARTEMAS